MCSVIAADHEQGLSHILGIFSADSAPKASAFRAKANAKMRAFDWKACDFGKENRARLLRMCGIIAVDGTQCLRRNSRIFSAEFAPSVRAFLRKTNAKMRAFGWREPQNACDFGAEVARGCAACAASSLQIMRKVCPIS